MKVEHATPLKSADIQSILPVSLNWAPDEMKFPCVLVTLGGCSERCHLGRASCDRLVVITPHLALGPGRLPCGGSPSPLNSSAVQSMRGHSRGEEGRRGKSLYVSPSPLSCRTG